MNEQPDIGKRRRRAEVFLSSANKEEHSSKAKTPHSIVRIEPEATYVKRWMRSGDQVVLLSANPKYPPIFVGAEETAIVIGKVVCIIHKCK
jgi:hypothetical protein